MHWNSDLSKMATTEPMRLPKTSWNSMSIKPSRNLGNGCDVLLCLTKILASLGHNQSDASKKYGVKEFNLSDISPVLITSHVFQMDIYGHGLQGARLKEDYAPHEILSQIKSRIVGSAGSNKAVCKAWLLLLQKALVCTGLSPKCLNSKVTQSRRPELFMSPWQSDKSIPAKMQKVWPAQAA